MAPALRLQKWLARFALSGDLSKPHKLSLNGPGYGYLFAAGLVALAALVRWTLGLLAENVLTFAVFYPVVLLTAFWWGLRPAVFSLAISGLVAWYFFLPPPLSFSVPNLGTTISLVLYFACGTLIIYVAHAYHREQERRALLLREFAHRSRNTFAVAQAIVSQSLGGNPAADVINRRFAALSSTNQLLMDSDDQTATIRDIISTELECHDLDRFSVLGPRVTLSGPVAQGLALTIHELATNSAKHGALSAPHGKVSLNWQVAGAEVKLKWEESGGPLVTKPTHTGFGTSIIRSLLSAHQGAATLDYRPTGLVCVLTFRDDRT